MSEAIDNAEVMLSCISLAYKESASKDPHLKRSLAMLFALHLRELRLVSHRVASYPDCRLEMQYGHQQQVDMIPLMMTQGYKPTGWREYQYLYQALRSFLQHRRHAVNMGSCCW